MTTRITHEHEYNNVSSMKFLSHIPYEITCKICWTPCTMILGRRNCWKDLHIESLIDTDGKNRLSNHLLPPNTSHNIVSITLPQGPQGKQFIEPIRTYDFSKLTSLEIRRGFRFSTKEEKELYYNSYMRNYYANLSSVLIKLGQSLLSLGFSFWGEESGKGIPSLAQIL
ncbi:hypothetical protein BDA99DRAFT_576436 [Phascolomyces articulosus]|uniref:Uncharacterized protein n=1 Tax=Phascolomyces articulosus TaxID=60185 RepID=A0AAD5P8B7_9FUNG|nr:hypothetical protein BDA99DRAFT_576436 [Phascolomyces articulosus]